MPEAIKKLIEPFLALSVAKRWIVGGVLGLSILMFTLLIVFANRTEYRPLFARLSGEDAGEIVRKLKEQKVPYRIEADGSAILVPADKVYELRLSLASEGLPQGGGVGFEIFDRKNFGMTEFVQKLNYQRALQGELSRTISQLTGVEQARVHLAIPAKSLFKDEEKAPSASVVLKMKTAAPPRDSEVQGIVHLVASSVEGMDPDNVSVLDSRGKVLSRTGGSDLNGKMTSTMLEMQRSYEKTVEERLQVNPGQGRRDRQIGGQGQRGVRFQAGGEVRGTLRPGIDRCQERAAARGKERRDRRRFGNPRRTVQYRQGNPSRCRPAPEPGLQKR